MSLTRRASQRARVTSAHHHVHTASRRVSLPSLNSCVWTSFPRRVGPTPEPEPEPELVAEEEEDSDTGALSEIDHEDEADQAEDEADEENDEVSPWVAPNGTTYLRTEEDGTLYDLKTHELVGEWDDEKNELRPFDVEDDEE